MNQQDPRGAILRPEQAARYLGITKRHLYNIAERDSTFPRKIVFSVRCVGWRRESLEQWLQAKEGDAA